MKIERPIIALDFPDREACRNFLKKFPEEEKLFVKIGMELYYSEGQDMVKAMRVLGKLGVSLTTLHASGGSEMMKAAKNGLLEGAQSNGKKAPKLLAITQLTSTSPEMAKKEQRIACDLAESVKSYAELAQQSGMDGVVCSAWEARMIADATNDDFLRVTPGIRLKGGDIGDQKRVMTPDEAEMNGSSAIVVGRAITQAQNPVEAYRLVSNLWRNQQ